MIRRSAIPILSATCALLAVSSLCADPAKLAGAFLAERGIATGYDTGAETCVFIGTASRIATMPVSAPGFLSARNLAVKSAERDARAKIMRAVSSTATGERSASLKTEGAAASASFRAFAEIFSNEPLLGCETLCVREERDGTRIRVAVAMKWSAAVEAEAAAARSDNVDLGAVSGADEWKAWAESFDFAHAGCSASFKGSDGIRRWVGIGYADIDGKKGPMSASAMRTARMSATAELAYALFGEAEAQSIARRMREESSAGNGEADALDADGFEKRIALAVKGKTVRDTEVYSTTVVHPLMGRKLFVSVAGIEPGDLAKMRLQ